MVSLFSFINDIAPYWWWVMLVFVFLSLEVLVSGFFFLWLAAAALAMGGITAVFPISWPWQIALFACLSLLSVVMGRYLMKKYQKTTDNPLLNQRTARMVGRTYVLLEPIKNGKGVIKAGDTRWIVYGEKDAKAGTEVTVIKAGEDSLYVKIK